MRIALFGHFMYQLAAGLRYNPENDVRLFLDSRTIPTCLRREPLLADPTFAIVAPWVVVNGAPDSQILPSHLVAQGFYLLRGRTQRREITNILLK